MAPIALVVGAVAAVGGTAYSINRQNKADRYNRAAVRKQEEQQKLATRESRRQGIRGAQLARAQAVAGAYASGAEGSSSAIGGIGAIQSQLGQQLGFSTQMSGLSAQINEYNRVANKSMFQAQQGADAASIGGKLYAYGYNNGARFSDFVPNKAPVPTGNTISAFPMYSTGK
jgi:hypothetical protein